MILGKRVIAVIPARGGSKGVRGKNLRLVGGKTLVQRAAMCVPDQVDGRYIFTDDAEIARMGATCGLEPIERAPSADDELISDALAVPAIARLKFDVLLLLEPTVIRHQTDDVNDAAIRLIGAPHLSSLATVSYVPAEYHPAKQLVGSMLPTDSWAPGLPRLTQYRIAASPVVNRQTLPTTYYRNGICYALRREHVLSGAFYGATPGYIVTDPPIANINTEADIERAERWLTYNH